LGSTQQGIIDDIQKLRNAARRNSWTDTSPVSPESIALFSDFSREISTVRQGIVQAVTQITPDLVQFLQRNPQASYGLHSRQFEELVAHVFEQFGFTVELTAASRDKGRDVIAIRHGIKPLKLLIECKHYHPSNTVGIAIVQRLYGVTHLNGADRGILATTSYFTSDAKEVLNQDPLRIEGRDYEGFVQWLKDYDAYTIGRKAIGPE
jgi:restriction system protein